MTAPDERAAVLEQCGSLADAELCYPFGDGVAVYKVGGKMFAIVSIGDGPGAATLKCDPEEATALRASHEAVSAGYHMDKRHWITIDLGVDMPAGLVADLVGNSYELIVASLPAKRRPAPV
ncbi:MAG: MmcQ/YjbR family DNA-binding protein [Acidimicrobiales bacterium]